MAEQKIWIADKSKTLEQQGTFLGVVRLLTPYIWPRDRADLKFRVVLAIALMIASKFITIAIPYSFKWATDSLTGAASAKPIPLPSALAGMFALTVIYGALRILMSLTQQGRDALFAAVAMNAVRRLAMEVFVHLHQLSLRFHLERKTGGLTRVLERGRAAIETIVRTSMLTAAPTAVEFALIVGAFLFTFDWRYVAVLIVTVALYLVYTTVATNWRISIRRSMNESDTDANTKAIDSLLNFETVKYFGAEDREAARYEKSMARYERMSVRTYVSLAVLNAGQAVIFTIGMVAVLLMCVSGVRSGRNTVGDFALLNVMMLQLYQPLNFMGMVYREIRQAIIDIGAMFDILSQNPEIKDVPGAPDLIVSKGVVKFENVVFAYDAQRPILKGVSFEAPAGSTVAIVGPSGAGKSTISRLLFRFYEPGQGRITIDGQDIGKITQTSLRAAIGMVPQDTVLFNDTVAYNVGYGRDGATDAEVREAAERARIDGFISSLPMGYDSQVGERGLKLSGGEKQRAAIARTILKAPPILVLDEATSALDSHTEREIQDALESVARGRTTLVIAHRLSTVVNADEILVLEKGVIAERGRHEALLARGGLYAALWNRQRQVDEAQEKLREADRAEHELEESAEAAE
jgi:ABC-type transport system involved in Fe-S cluster assembly fused permease/ATPase subunit